MLLSYILTYNICKYSINLIDYRASKIDKNNVGMYLKLNKINIFEATIEFDHSPSRFWMQGPWEE